MNIVDPKEEKKLVKKPIEGAQKCANEVNEIMQKHNCRFSIQTLIEDGQISHGVMIKEIKENKDGDNIVKN